MYEKVNTSEELPVKGGYYALVMAEREFTEMSIGLLKDKSGLWKTDLSLNRPILNIG